MSTKKYISLEVLAATFRLPLNYLRELAKENIIPSLNVNGRFREFCLGHLLGQNLHKTGYFERQPETGKPRYYAKNRIFGSGKSTPRGLEQNSIKTDSNASYESGTEQGWPEKWPDSAKMPKISPELKQIITAWPKLSAEQKQAILNIINKRQ